jgi:PmbA protein
MEILNKIQNTEADFIQVNLNERISDKILFEKSQVKDYSKLNEKRVAVSAWIGKKQGIAIGNKFSSRLVEKAIKIAKISDDLEFFYGLPQKPGLEKVRGIFYGEKTEDEILDSAKSLLFDLEKKETMSEANFDYSIGKKRVVNSIGVDKEEKESSFDISVQYVIQGKNNISHWDAFSGRKIPGKKEIRDFSERVLRETRELKNPVKIQDKPEIIVLSYNALAQLLESAFLSNLNGLNVLKGRSIFNGKNEEKLFSEDFSLTDTGIREGGVSSSSFDGEGVESQETRLIERGILKNFIYDYNTGIKAGRKSTGNSTGGGIGFNNIVIEKGEGIQEDRYVLIHDVIGAHTADEITTDFSLKSHGALLVERGERRALKDLMISGRMSEAFKNIAGVGKEIRNAGGVYVPEIAFKKIKLEFL